MFVCICVYVYMYLTGWSHMYVYLTSWSHMYVYLASWSHMCVCPEHGCHTWIYYIYQVCVSRVYLVYMSRAHICIIYQSVRQNIWESRENRVPPGVGVGGNVYVAAGPNIPRPKNLPARIVQVERVTMGWYTIVPAPTDQSSDIHRPALTSFLSDCNIQPKWNLEIRQKILKILKNNSNFKLSQHNLTYPN